MAEVLGTFEQAVLLAIMHLRSDAYGRAILKETAASLERDVVAGAIYSTLDRLENKGLVESRLGEGTPVRGGRARRYYLVSAIGVQALADSKATLQRLWRYGRQPMRARV